MPGKIASASVLLLRESKKKHLYLRIVISSHIIPNDIHFIYIFRSEYGFLKKAAIYKASFNVLSVSMIKIAVLFAMLGLMWDQPVDMSPNRVYLAFTMLYSIQFSISSMFSAGISGIVHVVSSLQRIVVSFLFV